MNTTVLFRVCIKRVCLCVMRITVQHVKTVIMSSNGKFRIHSFWFTIQGVKVSMSLPPLIQFDQFLTAILAVFRHELRNLSFHNYK